jgi:UDP-N-acetylmuramyl pentapeptide phosphotransferase/UDP-N-acetylglucosamine-1-phosphate transferase
LPHPWFSIDTHDGVQKFHKHPTPRVGGIAIFAGVLLAALVAQPNRQTLLLPLVVAGIPAFFFGLLEDITKRVGVGPRLLATMASGTLGWYLTGYSITSVDVMGVDAILGVTAVAVVFTSFAVGGVANAINIIDGFNGLAAGTAILILSGFYAVATQFGDSDLARVSLILAAAVLGFLFINWPLGKLFLGDGGAYFLGFCIGWLAVLLLQRHTQVSAWAPLMLCAYPVTEVLYSVWRRRRRRAHPGHPDRLHLHSLIKRRVASRLLPGHGTLARNSLTGVLMWLASVPPVIAASVWPTNTWVLAVWALTYVCLYIAVYTRLTQFVWCLGPKQEKRFSAIGRNMNSAP